MTLKLPNVNLRFLAAPSDGSVIRSAAVAVWWAQTQVSDERRTIGVFLLNNIRNKEVTFITNDWKIVDKILKTKFVGPSLKEWYDSKIIADKSWNVRMPRMKTLDELCGEYSCLSSIMESSKNRRELTFATVRFVQPEKVKNLSEMLLLFGVLHREQSITVRWEDLHPVVANFLDKMMQTGKIDLGWLGYDKEDPDVLIWAGEQPPYYA